jgi:ADP-heptose:LPS heptosyltransferase
VKIYGEAPWTAEQGASFGEFEAAFNTRHDRDAFARCMALRAEARYGYETSEVPEKLCRKGYTAYLPLSMWDEEPLRWHASVSEQGAALVRLVDPGFHIDFPRLGLEDFKVDFPEDRPPWQGGKTVLFVPGAGTVEKRWPMERFLELARNARGEGWNVVFQTGPCERDSGKLAEAAGFAVSDTPSLARMAGQMLLAWCVVGNDTGPMHLAAMLGVPTLTLHFHGSGDTWFPYGSDERAEHVVLSPGCARARCLDRCREAASCGKQIPFGTVAAAWKALCEGERNLKRKTTNKRSKSS